MSEQQIVIFKLDKVEYGIGITQVNEIVKLQAITKIPNTPDYVEGVINLRGKVISIVDLKIRFKVAAKERNDDTRIIVVTVNDKTIGMIVDEVAEVIRINDSQIEDSASISVHISEEFIKGIAKIEDRLIILLNLEKVFK
ncbi:MAG: chemotaxis protein CheW [Bacillota bacterium]